ncbi:MULTISPECIES: hypothetical protein [Vibrio]|uniref:hypothetical protein n=1 Tax=Vibrio TaxID=662 RepID=UPI002074ACDE|nr:MULTISPECIES: hypothetical protein [Vibrio]USD33644.1 hypothetical protein J8Z27_05935 [Vibrio sp. SCSIO 43186]USD46712.1 hypothetical protein J4N38_06110 [Vibrio sp. SCSIO 43145]USD70769.1 hypothetical protein J4N41_05935 [Vibrio sp. SCSIO 43139]USD95686.1 hypothetical protein CTT30_06015 [Vibrio coralliilyticus]
MSIPNNPLKTDNQRLAVLYLVVLSVYGGLFEFYGIVGSRLARALGCFKFVRFFSLASSHFNNIVFASASGHVARTFLGEGFLLLTNICVSRQSVFCFKCSCPSLFIGSSLSQFG